jgi:hypothetical protein
VPTLPQNMPVDAVALAVGLAVLVAAALVLRRALRALGVTGGADSAATGMALLLVLDALALVVWFLDPYAGLLLLGAVHLWPVVADPQLRPRVPVSLALVIGGIALPAGVIALYAHQLGMGPIAVAWMALLLAAGGHVGVAVAALWSVGLGCLAAVTLIALRGVVGNPEPPPVTVRGPVSYAGPGSLGGTESALRR